LPSAVTLPPTSLQTWLIISNNHKSRDGTGLFSKLADPIDIVPNQADMHALIQVWICYDQHGPNRTFRAHMIQSECPPS
jgi:hypothetical protein